MRLSLADVARMRLLSQGLIDVFPSPQNAVRHLGCLQGQDYPGSSVSVALRTQNRSLSEVRDAYDAGLIVRSWPMRGTLFVLPASDALWITALTAERTRRVAARRREELGLTPEIEERARAIAEDALSGGGLTRAGMMTRWNEVGVRTDEGRGYHLLSDLAVLGIVCQGPTSGREQRFVLTREWITNPLHLDRDAAVAELLRRYVLSRGPVPLDDFCGWSKITKTEARAALAEVASGFASAEVDGRTFWMAPDLPDRYTAHKRATAAPLALPGFDEIVLGYGDRSAVLTKAEEKLVVPGGNGVFKGTVLHRGHAVGTWARPTKKAEPITVTPFGDLPAPVTSALPRLTAALPT